MRPQTFLYSIEEKKVDKKSDSTQDFFDYVAEHAEAPVASTDLEGTTSDTSETSKTAEPAIDGSETSNHPKSLSLFVNINDIWEREANLEWSKRLKFLFGRIVQGNCTANKFYLKLKECDLVKDYPKWLLKNLFLREVTPENAFNVFSDGLEVLALDEIVKRLSPEQ
ncbi:9060_t:CDS:2 [Acaulospora colombiana]|uniref:9060_t:CDS:1 n=1 Tax=Acaulospora colombiana TaxID=27376 RepID=A0ACA9LIG9_9GLOM|nr:9060_t:CDS:2 [Acaulospora colombiana]